jgi:hypothetical protein
LEIVLAGVKRHQESELFHHFASVPVARHPRNASTDSGRVTGYAMSTVETG